MEPPGSPWSKSDLIWNSSSAAVTQKPLSVSAGLCLWQLRPLWSTVASHFYYLGMFDNLWSTSCCKTSKTKTHFVPLNIFRLLVERSKASRWYLWNLHHTVSRVTTACSSKCYCSILIFKFAYRSHDLSRPANGDFRAKFAARCHFKRGGPWFRHPTTADPSSLLTKDCAFRSWIKSNIETLTWTNELHQIRILLWERVFNVQLFWSIEKLSSGLLAILGWSNK